MACFALAAFAAHASGPPSGAIAMSSFLYGHAGGSNDQILIASPDGRLFRLENKGDAFAWETVSDRSLDAPEFQLPLGESLTKGGKIRIRDKRYIELWNGSIWTDAGVRPPPTGMTYEAAHLDAAGNLAVELGGTGQGFNFKFKNGPVIIAKNLRWKTEIPQVKQLAENPEGPGYLAICADGSVWQLTPPDRKHKEFVPTKVASAGSAERFYPWDEKHVVVETPSHDFAVIGGTGLKLVPAPRPSSLSGEYKVISSRIGRVEGAPPPPPEAPKELVYGAPLQSEVKLSPEELVAAIADRRDRVTEFREISRLAKEKGLRVFLFGGTAASFGHYVRWNLLNEKGDARFAKERFDYDFNNIYKTTQDIDIVITRADGTAESQSDINDFQRLLQTRFPYFTGGHTQWEVRGLKTTNGTKDRLLDNPDFLNQHSDSNSTGLVELTRPEAPEPPVRDLRDWGNTLPRFATDLAEGRLHYYFSSLHSTTNRARNGINPPILSVIRYLIKAFQFGQGIEPEALPHIKQIIADFNPRHSMPGYVSEWIEKNGKKLFQNAVDVEFAWNTLEELGLRQKLIAIRNDAKSYGSLAWWMSKEPLRTKAHPKAHLFGGGGKPGKTAGELDIKTVAHETKDFEAFETIIASPIGTPKVFISRSSATGEAAMHGDGFYTLKGEKGGAGTGFHIRFEVDPSAVEGVDFTRHSSGIIGKDIILWKTASKLKIIPESLRFNPIAGLVFISDPEKRNEVGLQQLLTRKLLKHQFNDEERKELLEKVKVAAEKWRQHDASMKQDELNLLINTFKLTGSGLALETLLPHDEIIRLLSACHDEESRKAIVRHLVSQVKTSAEFIDLKNKLGSLSSWFEPILFDEHWDDFLRLGPTVKELDQLKASSLSAAAKERFYLHDLKEKIPELTKDPEAIRQLPKMRFRTAEGATKAMELCLPLVHQAKDFEPMLDFAKRGLFGPGAEYRQGIESFFLSHLDDFFKLDPDPKEVGWLEKRVITTLRGQSEVLTKAFELAKRPGGWERLAAIGQAIAGSSNSNAPGDFLMSRLDGILADPARPTIYELKKLERAMMRDEKTRMAYLKKVAALVKTPDEFIALMEMGDTSYTPKYREVAEHYFFEKLDWFLKLVPTPTGEQIARLKRSLVCSKEGYEKAVEKLMPLMDTPQAFLDLIEPWPASNVPGIDIEKLMAAHLDRFFSPHTPPRIDQVKRLERFVLHKRITAMLRERALPFVHTLDDLAMLVTPATNLPRHARLDDGEGFGLKHIDALLLREPKPTVDELRKFEREIRASGFARNELMKKGLALVNSARDFITLTEPRSWFGRVFPSAFRAGFIAEHRHRFLAMDPTPAEVRALEGNPVQQFMSFCARALMELAQPSHRRLSR